MNITKHILEPTGGVDREIGFYLAGLEEVRAQTIAIISDLTQDELSKRAVAGAHQIGGLALHLGECEYWWIQCAAAGREMTDEDVKFAHLHDTTETDFALKNYTAGDCIKFLDGVHRRSVETLANFTGGDMDRIFNFVHHPNPSAGTLRWILNRLIDHEANHKGQMAMLKRLMRPAPTGNGPGDSTA
jgi:uncharacterized damage-inducible protein DinB